VNGIKSDVNTQMMEAPAQSASEGGESISEGRKLVIPKDQEGLKVKCETQYQNRPSFLKGDENPQIAFDPLNYSIKHMAYEISYNFRHLNPNWVYHRLNRSNLQNSCGKRDKGFHA